MKFEIKQRIQGTMEEVEKAFLHPDYTPFLLKNHGVLLEAQVVEMKDEGDKVRRKVRYRPKPVIKSIGPREIPPEWFAFVEESTWDRKRKELTFKNVPTSNAISNMLTNTGTLRFRSVGSETERIAEGDIHIKVPFFLKPLALIAEKLIQSEGVKILEGEAPVLNRFISETIRSKA